MFTTAYEPPTTDGKGDLRANLRRASELLDQAGWKIDAKTRKLTDDKGETMTFTVLLVSPTSWTADEDFSLLLVALEAYDARGREAVASDLDARLHLHAVTLAAWLGAIVP